MKKLTNNAFVGNTRHFVNEIDSAGSEGLNGMKVDNDRLGQLRGLGLHESRHIKPQVDRFIFPVGLSASCHNRTINKGRNCTFDRSSIGTELTVFAPELAVRARFGKSVVHKFMDVRNSCCGVPG